MFLLISDIPFPLADLIYKNRPSAIGARQDAMATMSVANR
jgi:hypothetical protein